MQDKGNLQQDFLKEICEQQKTVFIYLVNGVKLQGVITKYDNFCISVSYNEVTQMVFKHAISTISLE